MSYRLRVSVFFLAFLLSSTCHAQPANRVTILYDAFGKSPSVTMNFGFAALVEYGGKRILFDTGNNCRPSDCFPARAHAREKALTWLN